MDRRILIFPVLMALSALNFDLCAMQTSPENPVSGELRPSAESTRSAEGFLARQRPRELDEDIQTQQEPQRQRRRLDNPEEDSQTTRGQKRPSPSASLQGHRNAGLINNGQNICYLNSIIQCLSNLKTFRTGLIANEDTYHEKPLISNLISLFEQLRITEEPAIQNQDFVALAKKLIENQKDNRMKTFQDADEMLTLLLGEINKPDRIALEWQLAQKIKCTNPECLTESSKHEDCTTFPLPLNHIDAHNNLEELLEDFFNLSVPQDYQCESCRKIDSSSKTSKISGYKNDLIITLKRFNSNGSKISTPVKFPMDLDLKPYITDDLKQQEDLNLVYELAGFVCHGNNHYISIVKDFESGNWYIYDDSIVPPVRAYDVQNIASNKTPLRGFTPYILFYQKKSGGQAASAQQQQQQPGVTFDSDDDDEGLVAPQPPTQRRRAEAGAYVISVAAAGTIKISQQSKNQFWRLYDWVKSKIKRTPAKIPQQHPQQQILMRISQPSIIPNKPNVGLTKAEELPSLNSVVQCLSNLKHFSGILLENTESYKDDFFLSSLINLIKNLKISDSPISDQNFIEQTQILIKQKTNADDFLNFLLGWIHKASLENVGVDALLPLTLQTRVITECKQCKHSSDENIATQQKISLDLEKCKNINEFLNEQFLPFFNKTRICKHCHRMGASVTTQKILHYPSELILSLKRFDKDGNIDLLPITFPLSLNIKPFLTKELIPQVTHAEYELIGIVCLKNESQYYSYVKNHESGKWSLYNDESVAEVSMQNIETLTSFGIDSQQFVPYILLYQLKNSMDFTPQQDTLCSQFLDLESQRATAVLEEMSKLEREKNKKLRDLQHAKELERSADKNLVNANLDGADLSELDLNGADLTGASLVGATLNGTKLNGANLTNAKLNNATLSNVQLCNTTLNNTDLSHSKISDITAHHVSIINGTKFEDATIKNLSLKDSVIQNSSFANANLTKVKFETSTIDHVNMHHINASDIYFNESMLTNIDFSRAFMAGLDIKCAKIIGINLNFRYATLSVGCFRGETCSRNLKVGENRTEGITEKESPGKAFWGPVAGCAVLGQSFIPIPGVGAAIGAAGGVVVGAIGDVFHDEYLDWNKEFGTSNINSILRNSDFYGTALEDFFVQHLKFSDCINIGRIRKVIGILFDNIVSNNPQDVSDLLKKGARVNKTHLDEFKVIWGDNTSEWKTFFGDLLYRAANGAILEGISRIEPKINGTQKAQELKIKEIVADEVKKQIGAL